MNFVFGYFSDNKQFVVANFLESIKIGGDTFAQIIYKFSELFIFAEVTTIK